MTDYLLRLAQRTLGLTETLQPIIPSRFEQGMPLVGEEIGNRILEEVAGEQTFEVRPSQPQQPIVDRSAQHPTRTVTPVGLPQTTSNPETSTISIAFPTSQSAPTVSLPRQPAFSAPNEGQIHNAPLAPQAWGESHVQSSPESGDVVSETDLGIQLSPLAPTLTQAHWEPTIERSQTVGLSLNSLQPQREANSSPFVSSQPQNPVSFIEEQPTAYQPEPGKQNLPSVLLQAAPIQLAAHVVVNSFTPSTAAYPVNSSLVQPQNTGLAPLAPQGWGEPHFQSSPTLGDVVSEKDLSIQLSPLAPTLTQAHWEPTIERSQTLSLSLNSSQPELEANSSPFVSSQPQNPVSLVEEQPTAYQPFEPGKQHLPSVLLQAAPIQPAAHVAVNPLTSPTAAYPVNSSLVQPQNTGLAPLAPHAWGESHVQSSPESGDLGGETDLGIQLSPVAPTPTQAHWEPTIERSQTLSPSLNALQPHREANRSPFVDRQPQNPVSFIEEPSIGEQPEIAGKQQLRLVSSQAPPIQLAADVPVNPLTPPTATYPVNSSLVRHHHTGLPPQAWGGSHVQSSPQLGDVVSETDLGIQLSPLAPTPTQAHGEQSIERSQTLSPSLNASQPQREANRSPFVSSQPQNPVSFIEEQPTAYQPFGSGKQHLPSVPPQAAPIQLAAHLAINSFIPPTAAYHRYSSLVQPQNTGLTSQAWEESHVQSSPESGDVVSKTDLGIQLSPVAPTPTQAHWEPTIERSQTLSPSLNSSQPEAEGKSSPFVSPHQQNSVSFFGEQSSAQQVKIAGNQPLRLVPLHAPLPIQRVTNVAVNPFSPVTKTYREYSSLVPPQNAGLAPQCWEESQFQSSPELGDLGGEKDLGIQLSLNPTISNRAHSQPIIERSQTLSLSLNSSQPQREGNSSPFVSSQPQNPVSSAGEQPLVEQAQMAGQQQVMLLPPQAVAPSQPVANVAANSFIPSTEVYREYKTLVQQQNTGMTPLAQGWEESQFQSSPELGDVGGEKDLGIQLSLNPTISNRAHSEPIIQRSQTLSPLLNSLQPQREGDSSPFVSSHQQNPVSSVGEQLSAQQVEIAGKQQSRVVSPQAAPPIQSVANVAVNPFTPVTETYQEYSSLVPPQNTGLVPQVWGESQVQNPPELGDFGGEQDLHIQARTPTKAPTIPIATNSAEHSRPRPSPQPTLRQDGIHPTLVSESLNTATPEPAQIVQLISSPIQPDRQEAKLQLAPLLPPAPASARQDANLPPSLPSIQANPLEPESALVDLPFSETTPLVDQSSIHAPTPVPSSTGILGLSAIAETLSESPLPSSNPQPPTPSISVNIGRIQVQGIQPPAPPPPRATRRRPSLSLREYLDRSRGGHR